MFRRSRDEDYVHRALSTPLIPAHCALIEPARCFSSEQTKSSTTTEASWKQAADKSAQPCWCAPAAGLIRIRWPGDHGVDRKW